MRLQEVKMGTNVLRKVLTHHGDKVVAGFEAEVIIPRLAEEVDSSAPASDFESWEDVSGYLNLQYNITVYPNQLNDDFNEWMSDKVTAIIEDNRSSFEEEFSPDDYNTPEDWMEAVSDVVWEDSTYNDDLAFWRFMEENNWDTFGQMAEQYGLNPYEFNRSDFQRDAEDSMRYSNSTYEEASAWDEAIGMPVSVMLDAKQENKSPNHWYFEPDSSITPDDIDAEYGQEIVSPPLSLQMMLKSLETFYSFAKQRGYRTNSSTGLHIGISVPDMDKMDLTKFIMFLGDEYILRKFEREASIYAKSMSAGLRDEIIASDRTRYVTAEVAANRTSLVRQWLDSPQMHELATKVIREYMSDVKYSSVNITHDGYIEVRSPGGDWLSQFQNVYLTVLRLGKAILLATDKNAAKQEYARKLAKFFEQLKPTLLAALPRPRTLGASPVKKEAPLPATRLP